MPLLLVCGHFSGVPVCVGVLYYLALVNFTRKVIASEAMNIMNNVMEERDMVVDVSLSDEGGS